MPAITDLRDSQCPRRECVNYAELFLARAFVRIPSVALGCSLLGNVRNRPFRGPAFKKPLEHLYVCCSSFDPTYPV